MKHLVLAACLGALTLTAAGAASAQEPAKKTAAKKAPARKGKAAAAAAPAAAAIPANAVKWQCELGNSLHIAGDMQRDEVITVYWQGHDYRLPRQVTVTGADRYFDARTGLDLVVIPSKAMLFNKNQGQRLADECQTAEMQAGGSAPTQAGALRAPVATPLLAPSAQPQAQPEAAAQGQQAAPKQ